MPAEATAEEVEAAETRRESRVHMLGNLTLVTQALNSALTDAAWPEKRVELAKWGQLLVNQRLCAHEVWNEEAIDTRGAELASYIVTTWPGPDAAEWESEQAPALVVD